MRRALFAGVAFGAGLALTDLNRLRPGRLETMESSLAVLGATLLIAAGIVVVRALSTAVRLTLSSQTDQQRATIVATLTSVIGYGLLTVGVLDALGIAATHLLIGGAVTGVVLGIAAQTSLSNFFAGLVLLMVQPLVVGEHTFVRSASVGGGYEGVVTDVGLFHVAIETDDGAVLLPNNIVLTAAIGPGAGTPL